MRVASITLLAAGALAAWPAAAQQFGKAENLAPYIPTSALVVDRMLEAAHLHAGETVYDLGSGDGRILIAAAQKFGARGVGVEISPDLCEKAKARIKSLGLEEKIRMIHGSALRVDLSPADVVTMYLLTSSNERLKPNLDKYLKPGARVVSNEFPVKGWKPAEIITLTDAGMKHTIYVYEVGRNH
jgi:ubiquinone/menaquinone biosynthesis C-methylase UbiE